MYESTNSTDRLVSAQRLRQHVEALAVGPRSDRHAPAGMRAAREYVTQHLQGAGWVTRGQHVDVSGRWGLSDDPTGWRIWWPFTRHSHVRGTNVLAEREAHDTRPPLVIAAHLDTVKASPGADDNASGVAVLLELATVLSASEVPVLLAVLDLEEIGQFGAKALAQQLRAGRGATGMVALDAVGYYTDTAGSQQIPFGAGAGMPTVAKHARANDRRGDFAVVVHRRSSRALAEQWCAAAAAHSSGLVGVPLADPRPEGWLGRLVTFLLPATSNLDRSDHAPFWRAKVPAVLISDTASFRGGHYHRPTDTPETLDYERLAGVAEATRALAASLRG